PPLVHDARPLAHGRGGVAWQLLPLQVRPRALQRDELGELRPRRSLHLHGAHVPLRHARHGQRRFRDLPASLERGRAHVPASLLPPQRDERIHGAGERRVRREAGRLRARRGEPAQLHERARAGPGVLRQGGRGEPGAPAHRKHPRVHVREPLPLRAHRVRDVHAGARPRLRRGLGGPSQGQRPGGPVKLASLREHSRDGALVVVSRDLARAVRVPKIAASLQAALENWQAVAPLLADASAALENGADRHAFDFQEALAGDRVAAPLPRAYEWLDGSAYLSHVERVRRARNDTVPESYHRDPLMYQGGAGRMMGPRDPIRVLSTEWGVDLEGEVAAIVGDLAMGATPEEAG